MVYDILLTGDDMEKFNYKKKYGQNFLNDNNIVDKIVNSIDAGSDDLIIEIGPGSGALTKKLKNYKSHIIAFELDKETERFLSKLEDDKTQIVFNDFLEADVESYINETNFSKLHVIGNIPYYITTPIIKKVMNLNVDVSEVVLMVQKEVADRLSAKPGSKNFGSLTVFIGSMYDVFKITDVSKKCFIPEPKVDSSVIKLIPNNKYQIENREKFELFLKNAFKYKRKTIKNNLDNYDLNKVQQVLSKYNLSTSNRAEEVPIDVFVDLYNNL